MLAANCTKFVFSGTKMSHLYGTIYGFNILPLASILSIKWCRRGDISEPIHTYTTSGKIKRLLYYNEVIQLHFTYLLIRTWILYENNYRVGWTIVLCSPNTVLRRYCVFVSVFQLQASVVLGKKCSISWLSANKSIRNVNNYSAMDGSHVVNVSSSPKFPFNLAQRIKRAKNCAVIRPRHAQTCSNFQLHDIQENTMSLLSVTRTFGERGALLARHHTPKRTNILWSVHIIITTDTSKDSIQFKKDNTSSTFRIFFDMQPQRSTNTKYRTTYSSTFSAILHFVPDVIPGAGSWNQTSTQMRECFWKMTKQYIARFLKVAYTSITVYSLRNVNMEWLLKCLNIYRTMKGNFLIT